MMSLNESDHEVIKVMLEKEIKSLLRENKQILDISISYFDGTSIVSTSDNDTSYIMSAAASALRGIAEKISSMLDSGLFVKLIIQFEKEKVIVFSINKSINILLRATIEAPLGLLLRDISKLSNKLKTIIN